MQSRDTAQITQSLLTTGNVSDQQPEWANSALILEDGQILWGRGIGSGGVAIGEVCFNTALTGYQEILSDPSYADQIITFTAPHIGNVGINQLDREHPRPASLGVVMREAPSSPSNYRAEQSLGDWLKEKGLIGISGIDTRALTVKLRKGAQRAAIVTEYDCKIEARSLWTRVKGWDGLEGAELSLTVTGEKEGDQNAESIPPFIRWTEGSWHPPESQLDGVPKGEPELEATPRVVVIDFGIKDQILRCLKDRGCEVLVISPLLSSEDVLSLEPHGVCLSNGPGDPAATLEYARPLIAGLLEAQDLPLFGICLGHQLLGLTLGAQTQKMERGHRGANHPILNLMTGRVEITSQNHGFVVSGLPEGVTETHRSLFDGTIAGLELKGRPVRSVQYHPEASPGPHDSYYLFDRFVSDVLAFQRGERPSCDPQALEMSSSIKKRKIMIVGAGPIVIGQACEFDYSGAQACKSLRAAGHEVVLVNSNPATIMTDPQLADRTYIEPLTVEYLEAIIRAERPDTLLPTMGGQTALNVCLELAERGILSHWNVEMIGARREAIQTAEDRQLFREAMDEIGLASPRSHLATSIEEALIAVEDTQFPAIIRPSFTLGGSGGGIATDLEELKQIVTQGLKLSPVNSVLIEESLLGWKEYELEVVRDRRDNGIIVCSIENIDPMGIHTGDSITVAPALTLTDKEYQRLRDQALACLRRVGVDTGGSNVQFAVNPQDGRAVVIEMNPRVSRSSALASKATGFPIAKVASLLAVGHTLDELRNEITRVTPASFEPSIDYIVVKIPRFTFEKFSADVPELNTSMKSVGEVMAIGRSFAEALQKAFRGLELGHSGLNEQQLPLDKSLRLAWLENRVPYRLLYIAQALRMGDSIEELYHATAIDPWYLEQLQLLIEAETSLKNSSLEALEASHLLHYKRLGFSDARIAQLLEVSDESVVREHRWSRGVHPTFRRVDTCAAEFESHTQYLYSSYETSADAYGSLVSQESITLSSDEALPSDRKKVMILGGGPNRIGQGIEFDYCCVHAAYAIRDAGYEAIMVNCNPETVSTDYDTADRLYFEPLTAEDVIEIARVEASKGEFLGIIVQLGGQTPLNLCAALEEAGLPILGTPRDVIDRAEDRERFQALIEGLSLRQPMSAVAYSVDEAAQIASEVGYPVLLRPSYVLGGRAMRLVDDEASLRDLIYEAQAASHGGGVLIDQYLVGAIEVDVDALCDQDEVWVVGVMEHIEEAGVHSGDSACSLPPYSLSEDIIAEIKRQTKEIALELGVIGLMNIQFAVCGGHVYLIEVNPRASRTVPFVAKALDIPVARIATQLMLGTRLADLERPTPREGFIAVKEAVFPFARFPNSDLLLGPEMLSTGEVMGWDTSFELAFAKAQIATGTPLPREGNLLFVIGDASAREETFGLSLHLSRLGYQIHTTSETDLVWRSLAGELTYRSWDQDDLVEAIRSGTFALLISIDQPRSNAPLATAIRRAALAAEVPYFTRLTNSRALVGALRALATQEHPSVRPLQR